MGPLLHGDMHEKKTYGSLDVLLGKFRLLLSFPSHSGKSHMSFAQMPEESSRAGFNKGHLHVAEEPCPWRGTMSGFKWTPGEGDIGLARRELTLQFPQWHKPDNKHQMPVSY